MIWVCSYIASIISSISLYSNKCIGDYNTMAFSQKGGAQDESLFEDEIGT